MSHIFELAQKPIHYCDTDSIFVETRVEDAQFTLSDLTGEFSIPVVLEPRAMAIFRSYLERSTTSSQQKTRDTLFMESSTQWNSATGYIS